MIDLRIKFCEDTNFPFSKGEHAKIRMISEQLLTLIRKIRCLILLSIWMFEISYVQHGFQCDVIASLALGASEVDKN